MDAITKRAFSRNNHESQIRYAILNSDAFTDAKMCNNCEGGMYFESDNALMPGTDIRIKVMDKPFLHEHEACDGYKAEVMWCREMAKEGVGYGVGVRFMVNVCDKCGSKVSYHDIHKTEHLIFLCSDCHDQYLAMSDGKIKECMENYLMGNVL